MAGIANCQSHARTQGGLARLPGLRRAGAASGSTWPGLRRAGAASGRTWPGLRRAGAALARTLDWVCEPLDFPIQFAKVCEFHFGFANPARHGEL